MAEQEKILLAVLAHPDDESFGTGGTLAYYARQGVKVYLVCATRGEVGEMDAKFMDGFETPAARRESELRCAAETLGLSGVFFLDYRDSGMPGSKDNEHPSALAAQPLEKVAGEIAHFIRRLRPQVVITFDPIGGYRHPDHIAIHNATVQAFSEAQRDEPGVDGLKGHMAQRLYYQVIPRTFLRWMVRLMPLWGQDPRRFGQNKDIDLRSIAETSFPTHAVIDFRQVSSIRDQASACHASQGGGSLTGSGVVGSLRRWFFSKETYMRAYPAAEPGERVAHDLFEGVSAAS